jgi:hypothetical protein
MQAKALASAMPKGLSSDIAEECFVGEDTLVDDVHVIMIRGPRLSPEMITGTAGQDGLNPQLTIYLA